MRHLLTNEKQRNLLKCVSSPLSALSSLTMNVLVKRGTDLYERGEVLCWSVTEMM